MKALLKDTARNDFAGLWVDIDTSCLFNNQYNTTEQFGNCRIFDGDIERIKGDVRGGLGKCKYCGKIVEYGHEEDHFLEEEKKKSECSMDNTDKTCFWKSKKYLGKRNISSETKTEMKDGIATTVEVKTIEENWQPYCSYAERETYGQPSCACTCDEHRRMGIEWFMPQNTFFLRYPNGFRPLRFEKLSLNNDDNYEFNYNGRFCTRQHKIKSYEFRINFWNCNGDKGNVEYFELRNARDYIRFSYDPKNDEYIIFDGINGSPRVSKTILNHYRQTETDRIVERQLKNVIQKILEPAPKPEPKKHTQTYDEYQRELVINNID